VAEQRFDFIVVGAGSAGSPLAARLSESGKHKVLLLEAGGEDRNPWIHVPIGYAKTFLDERVNWKYETEPEPELNNRRIYWPRGKVLGGSSSINGLIYIRGIPSDFDHWRQLGNEGWSYDDVLPYFRKAEDQERGSDELHGKDGPIGVRDASFRTPLSDAYLKAAQEAGLPFNPDFNGRQQEGTGYYQLTTRGGRRCSSARAYLQPAKGRANLAIVTQALTERLLLDGKRVTGVRYRRGDAVETALASREVIICGGAINSPQLLQVSGIGPAAVLRRAGVDVAHELPGVGRNLHDHLQVRSQYKAKACVTLNDTLGKWHYRMLAGARYALNRSGPLTIGAGLVGVFARTRPELEDPDIQMHFIPFSTDKMGVTLHAFPGFTVTMNQSRPESRGTLEIRSADPREAPSIRPNYMTTETDRQTVIAGLRLVRKISEAKALQPYLLEEFQPGRAVQTDDEFLDFARQVGASIYHPVGTCRMGHDPAAVVDPQLRVHGLTGLRVADASVMPTVVSGNTNAACIMIGEKCADMVLRDAA
jgi:choline dehydrogenase